MAGKGREMKDIFEKWSEFITEEDDVRDTYDDEVEKRNKKSREQGAKKMGLEEGIAGKCQKGYKTDEDQPTKKLLMALHGQRYLIQIVTILKQVEQGLQLQVYL